MKIYFMRHGNPDYVTDSLTELGKKQAEKLGEYLKNVPFDAIYASSHGRAVETSMPTCKNHNMEPILCDWAREDRATKYYYNHNGVGPEKHWYFTSNTFRQKFVKEEIYKSGSDWAKNELLADTNLKIGDEVVSKDIDDFILSLGYEHDRVNHVYNKVGESPNIVALFAHGGYGMSFIPNVIDMPYPAFSAHFSHLDCASVSVIEFRDDVNCIPLIHRYNTTDFLGEYAEIYVKKQ